MESTTRIVGDCYICQKRPAAKTVFLIAVVRVSA